MDIRAWLLAPILSLLRTIMATVNDTKVATDKLTADLAIYVAASAAKDATIAGLTAANADLKSQLDAFQNDSVALDGIVGELNAADATIAPPAAPAPAP